MIIKARRLPIHHIKTGVEFKIGLGQTDVIYLWVHAAKSRMDSRFPSGV